MCRSVHVVIGECRQTLLPLLGRKSVSHCNVIVIDVMEKHLSDNITGGASSEHTQCSDQGVKSVAGNSSQAEPRKDDADAMTKPRCRRGRPMERQRLRVKLNPPYLNILNPEKAEELSRRIAELLIVNRRFRDKDVTAKGIAKELGTNTRYVSITMQLKFHANFTSFVNKLRIEDAMSLLADPRCEQLSIQDIYDMVGFSNRQCFINAFQRMCRMTPTEYRRQCSVRSGDN